jgi:hypothetical protein
MTLSRNPSGCDMLVNSSPLMSVCLRCSLASFAKDGDRHRRFDTTRGRRVMKASLNPTILSGVRKLLHVFSLLKLMERVE